jgi:lysine 2,3-aminomutase
MSIKPDGFDQIHARGGAKHRLRSDDQTKWKPAGVGSETRPEMTADTAAA